MQFRTRKIIKPGDLNPRGSLFGGACLAWIDEEAAIYAICQLGTDQLVTKYISEVNFVNPAFQGEIIEIGVDVIEFGTTSLTLTVEVREKSQKRPIVKIDKIVFVCVDKVGRPFPHGKIKKKS